MQLFGVKFSKFYRNRLTHSLEVSQIARGIATELGCLAKKEIYQGDLYVLEAASLAHDIGNPPFGHHGERILNKIMDEHGGFEGNAQTFRVLTKIEQKLPTEKGLNLTKRTLLSIVKYFRKRKKGDSLKFLYDEDYHLIEKLSGNLSVNPRTIDVQIMDLADEIAYGAHDLEDALSLHLFSIDEFLYDFKQKAEQESYKFLVERVKNAYKVANKAKNYKSSEEYAFLFRKELISNIVHRLIKDIDVVRVTRADKKETATLNRKELNFKTLKDFAKNLKKVTFECINRSDIVHIYEKKGEKIIKGLFEAFMDESFNKDNKLLPIEYRNKNKMRSITDYIAGMMDSYAIKVYKDIYGADSLATIYDRNYFSLFDYKFSSQ